MGEGVGYVMSWSYAGGICPVQGVPRGRVGLVLVLHRRNVHSVPVLPGSGDGKVRKGTLTR